MELAEPELGDSIVAPGESRQAPYSDRFPDLLIAEYEALRSENDARISAQVSIVGFVLTIAAALSAVALSKGTSFSAGEKTPDRLLLLLLVPLVVNGLGFNYLVQNIARSRIAAYTRDVLYPAFTDRSDLWPWATAHRRAHRTQRFYIASVHVFSNLAIFATFDVVALLLVFSKAFHSSPAAAGVWVLGAASSVLLIAAAAASASEFGQPIEAPLISSRKVHYGQAGSDGQDEGQGQ